MKCPKCGYNSFESYDACKKCANDLTGFKQTHGIQPIVLPLEIRQKMAEELMTSDDSGSQQSESVEAGDDMFAFDLPDDEQAVSAASSINDDPFNFDDDPEESISSFGAPAAQAIPEEDAFASLLESTSQVEDDPFAEAVTAPVAPAKPAAAAAPGEFDLENFSWDDTPVPAGAEQGPADDFDSLFGDPEDKK